MNLLAGLGLAISLIFILQQLFRKDNSHLDTYDAATNLVRNGLEIVAIAFAGLISLKSSWFHDFFWTRTVEINGIVWDEGKTPKAIIADKELKFLYEFISEKDGEKPVFLIVVSDNGMLKSSIRLECSYRKATIKLLSSGYMFKDYPINRMTFNDTLDVGYQLHFSPPLESDNVADSKKKSGSG